MSPRKRILFLSSPEYGHSNIALAVLYEFLLRDQFEIHIASFPALEARLNKINRDVVNVFRKLGLEERCAATDSAVKQIPQSTFHTVQGISLTEILNKKDIDFSHGPGISGALAGVDKVNQIILGAKPTQYIAAYRSCLSVLEKVTPTLVVLDPLFQSAVDACRSTSSHFIMLWPNLLKDVVITVQPKGSFMWKHPILGSGYPFPLPWHLVLANIYLSIRIIIAFLLGSQLQNSIKCREQIGIRHKHPLLEPYKTDDLLHIAPAHQEMDFPLYVPANVFCAGPILLPAEPLSDPDMMDWLQRPTILVNLGSIAKLSMKMAMQMAEGLRVVLERKPVQVLWKLKTDQVVMEEVQNTLSDFGSRVIITPWIQPEIVSVLGSQHVVAFVHHGGANTFFEACKTGVPQVVLPQWLDTYDAGNRCEWLGIGLYGSRTAAPSADATEFSNALLRVITDVKFRESSEKIRELCAKSEGREVACKKITELANAVESYDTQ